MSSSIFTEISHLQHMLGIQIELNIELEEFTDPEVDSAKELHTKIITKYQPHEESRESGDFESEEPV